MGEANDYVCKGMAGGDVSIVPPPGSPFAAEEASIVGNTCLYGATGGRLFVNGRAGERYAVRNSRAETVVEGAGDHCCEYMTGEWAGGWTRWEGRGCCLCRAAGCVGGERALHLVWGLSVCVLRQTCHWHAVSVLHDCRTPSHSLNPPPPQPNPPHPTRGPLGGCVVSLGTVGRNVGAGMTGGLGYFLDVDGDFPDKVNGEIVVLQRVSTEAGEAQLRGLIEAHVERTGERGRCVCAWVDGEQVRCRACWQAFDPSPSLPCRPSDPLTPHTHARTHMHTGSAKGKAILADWEALLPLFWQVVPPSEANTPEVSAGIQAPSSVGGVVKATATA